MSIPTTFNRMGLALKPTPPPIDETDYLSFTANVDNSAIKLTKRYGNPSAISLEYSTDKRKWNTYTIDDIIELDEGNTVYFRGNNSSFNDPVAYYSFAASGSIAASGNVMSLIDKTCQTTTLTVKLPRLFSLCSALTTAPKLPATILAAYECYSYMFESCTGLITAPELPATTLYNGCYKRMFHGCTSLVNAPELPATTLAENCYEGMFYGCSQLKDAPRLPATTLENYCYYSMFNSCSALSSMEVDFTQWGNGQNNWHSYWVQYVNPGISNPKDGIFRCPKALSTIYGISRIPYGFTVEHTDDFENLPFYIEATTNNTVLYLHFNGTVQGNDVGYEEQGEGWEEPQMPIYHPAETHWDDELQEEVVDVEEWWEDMPPIYHEGETHWFSMYEPIPPYNLEYSTDNVTWQSAEFTAETFDTNLGQGPGGYYYFSLANAGDRIYFRGDNTAFYIDASAYGYLIAPNTEVGGNIMSLLDPTMQQTEAPDNCFRNLFCIPNGYDTAGILDAKNLSMPATEIGESCYREMFMNNTTLSSAPSCLPATTLSGNNCYQSMFAGCTGLTKAPALPATTLSDRCYFGMFLGCTLLSAAPELPATNVAYNCYATMFKNCSSLTTPPTELPAATLANNCYTQMFNGCTSLSAAPELPATTLAPICYQAMFYGCTSLSAAPELPATTLVSRCYEDMFRNCSNINEVKVSFTDWNSAETSTANWLRDTANTGTFYCPSNLDTTTRDTSHVPDGWTVVHNDYFYVKALSPNSSVGIGYSGILPIVNEGEGEWVDTGEGEWIYPEPEWDPDANDGEGDWIRGDPEWVPAEPEWVPAEPEYGVGINMEYSTDLVNWSTLDILNVQQVSLPNVGDRVYFRGHNVTFSTAEINDIYDDGHTEMAFPDQNIDSVLYYFTGVGACKIGGNLLSICDSSSMSDSLVCNFSKLFNGLGVVDASDLKLPSFTVYNSCKYMFARTPLLAAPELPATSAYYDQYKGFFQECTSLTVAPAIHIAIDSNSTAMLEDMFNGCTSLSSVTVDFQNWENSFGGLATTNWLYAVAASGTFTCASGLDTTVTRGPDTIPDGWTVVTV